MLCGYKYITKLNDHDIFVYKLFLCINVSLTTRKKNVCNTFFCSKIINPKFSIVLKKQIQWKSTKRFLCISAIIYQTNVIRYSYITTYLIWFWLGKSDLIIIDNFPFIYTVKCSVQLFNSHRFYLRNYCHHTFVVKTFDIFPIITFFFRLFKLYFRTSILIKFSFLLNTKSFFMLSTTKHSGKSFNGIFLLEGKM